MRKMMTAVVVAAAAAACGGNDLSFDPNNPNGGNCKVTLSGAVTGTYACVVAAAHDNSNNKTGFVISADKSGTLQSVLFALDLGSADLQTGTWSQTSSAPAGTVVQTTDNKLWSQSRNEGSADVGTYTLNITNAGSSLSSSGGKAWTGVRGSFNASLVAESGSGATGTVSVSATF